MAASRRPRAIETCGRTRPGYRVPWSRLNPRYFRASSGGRIRVVDPGPDPQYGGGVVRIDLVEKLILFLAGLAVLAVAGFVTFCSLLPGGLRSGIPEVVEVSALTTQDWLDGQRR